MELLGILLLVPGCIGFAIGSIVVLTMRASAARRLIAVALVFLAAVIGIALVIVGLVRPLFGLGGSLLIPVLTSLGLRYLASRRSS